MKFAFHILAVLMLSPLAAICAADILQPAAPDIRVPVVESLTQLKTESRQPHYIIFEGGGPDQGPGRDNDKNRAALLRKFGPADPSSSRMVGYGIQQIRILTRSVAVVAKDVEMALDAAERSGLPVWLHIDPLYAWGADGEESAADAPPMKFWENPEMREWIEFPAGDALPDYIPRPWFNWGPWCSPVSAVPAIGAPKFIGFAAAQLRDGVLVPLAARLGRWSKEGRDYLFAGINIGWETHMFEYKSRRSIGSLTNKENPAVGEQPENVRGLKFDPKLLGTQPGYASLHWRGWTEAKLRAAAAARGISRDNMFDRLIYECIHDYMEALARTCHEAGVGREKVYTHIVALSTVNPANTFMPPVWTAVNSYSTPGFTMDNHGGAKYDMARLKNDLTAAPGSRGAVFANVETYFGLGGKNYVSDASACQKEIDTLFGDGATAMVLFGTFPFGPKTSAEGVAAIQAWLKAAPSRN